MGNIELFNILSKKPPEVYMNIDDYHIAGSTSSNSTGGRMIQWGQAVTLFLQGPP